MPDHAIAQLLLKRLLKQALSFLELAELGHWAKRSPFHRQLLDDLSDENWVEKQLDDRRKEQVWQTIQQGLANRK